MYINAFENYNIFGVLLIAFSSSRKEEKPVIYCKHPRQFESPNSLVESQAVKDKNEQATHEEQLSVWCA